MDFNRAYQKLSVTEEIVLRASAVQSLGQIDGVDAVFFTIEGEPLEDQNGQEIGYMQPSDLYRIRDPVCMLIRMRHFFYIMEIKRAPVL